MHFLSAFERTLPQLHEMVELAGLRVKKVNATRSVNPRQLNYGQH
jgi:hypothetical protein